MILGGLICEIYVCARACVCFDLPSVTQNQRLRGCSIIFRGEKRQDIRKCVQAAQERSTIFLN